MDPIADMLTIIRNGYLARLSEVSCPYSKMKDKLAQILYAEGFISKPEITGRSPSLKRLKFALKYQNRQPVVSGLKMISKPGARRYSRVGKIPKIRFGFGVTVVSTSQGLMTDKDARQKKLGGEIICQVW